MMPPLSAFGVIEVMLSMKRCSSTLVSFAVHVAPDGDHIVTLGGKHRVHGPVSVRAHVHHLLSTLRIDCAYGEVRATERELASIRRPIRAVDGVERDRNRNREILFLHIPDLHLAHPSGQPTCDAELFSHQAKTPPTRSALTNPPSDRQAPSRPPCAIVPHEIRTPRAVTRPVKNRDR